MTEPHTHQPTRRLRKTSRRARRRQKRIRKALVVPRLLVLLAIGAVTVVAPLSGFVNSTKSSTVTAHALSLASGDSWASTPHSQLSLDDDDALISSPSSRAIARLKESSGDCKFSDTGSGNKTASQPDENSLIFPLAKGSFHQSSPFGYRIHPISGIQKLHEGVDFASSAGNAVRALTSGTIVQAGAYGGCGNAVTIEHNRDGEHFFTRYCHLLNSSIKVSEGQKVEPGQQIAAVGSTGNSTGPHLHFEVRPNSVDNPVDPVSWLNNHEYSYYGEQACD